MQKHLPVCQATHFDFPSESVMQNITVSTEKVWISESATIDILSFLVTEGEAFEID